MEKDRLKSVVVNGSFDDLRSRQVRFLERAARLGEVHLLLWSDEVVNAIKGKPPKFSLQERQYLVESLRYVSRVSVVNLPYNQNVLPQIEGLKPDIWAVGEPSDTQQAHAYCHSHGIEYRVIKDKEIQGFPYRRFDALETPSGRKKVVVSGCYDWLHSGHIRFFEEVSELGDLYVVVGSDRNVQHLKGKEHPLFSEEERRYMVAAVRYVKAALISSGHGWIDYEPEIKILKADIFAVNEDGDKPEKRAFCLEHGLEYAVLQRLPKEGLPRREATNMRGF